MKPEMQGQLQLAADDQIAPDERRAILVLGMHRSGTSALGGALNALGVAAPKTLLAPRPDNPKGFFESAALADAHDALLESADSCWDDWRHLGSRLGPTIADQHRQKLKALLIDEFEDAPLIFIKDPRMCRFVPFVLSVLAELEISPVAILPIRNPLEVAHSLKRRNGFSLSKSLLLWLRHVLDAEFNSRGLPRYFLPYEGFLNDWRLYMDRAAKTLNLNWPNRSDSSAKGIQNFLTADLYHEKASLEDLRNHPTILSMARQTYEILIAITVEGENANFLDQLDHIRNRFDNDCEMFGKVLESEFAMRQVRSKLGPQIAEAEQLQQKSFGFLAGPQNPALRPSAFRTDSVTSVHLEPIAQTKSRSIGDNLAMARTSLVNARQSIHTSQNLRSKLEQDKIVAGLSSQIVRRHQIAKLQLAELASAVRKLTAERDNLAELIVMRESELQVLKVKYDELTRLSAARELEMKRESDFLTASLQTVVAERDTIAAACNSLEIAHKDMLSSRSWRLTAPLRFLRGLFG